jgi:hypothetical protein
MRGKKRAFKKTTLCQRAVNLEKMREVVRGDKKGGLFKMRFTERKVQAI